MPYFTFMKWIKKRTFDLVSISMIWAFHHESGSLPLSSQFNIYKLSHFFNNDDFSLYKTVLFCHKMIHTEWRLKSKIIIRSRSNKSTGNYFYGHINNKSGAKGFWPVVQLLRPFYKVYLLVFGKSQYSSYVRNMRLVHLSSQPEFKRRILKQKSYYVETSFKFIV